MISRETIKAYLSKNLKEFKYTRQGGKVNCPRCDAGDKFNLEINLERNIFRCWGCDYSGPLRRLFEDYSTDSSWYTIPELQKKDEEHSDVERKEINVPKTMVPFYMKQEVKDYLLNDRGMIYGELVKRGVTYVYGESEIYNNHIFFPFYEHGRLVGACVQNFATKKYRNLGKLDFVPYKEFIDVNYPIIITEGIYDALSVVNAIPQLQVDLNNAIIDFLVGRDVILAVDNSVELSQYIKIMNKINERSVKSLTLFDMNRFKDLNEYLQEDHEALYREIKYCYGQIL